MIARAKRAEYISIFRSILSINTELNSKFDIDLSISIHIRDRVDPSYRAVHEIMVEELPPIYQGRPLEIEKKRSESSERNRFLRLMDR